MLVLSLAIFTIVAIQGLLLAVDVFKAQDSSVLFARIHAGLALLGSALVIAVALQGDTRVYINIGLAVAIIGLGFYIALQRNKGRHPKALVALHGGTAVACYLILAYFALGLGQRL
jgi:hypothetical protein